MAPANRAATGHHRSIAGRFAAFSVLVSLMVGLSITLPTVYLGYREELRRLDYQLFQIQKSHVPPLVSSLWLTNAAAVERQLEAISRFPYIERVEVIDDDGTVYAAGVGARERFDVTEQPLLYTHRESEVLIGRLWIFTDSVQMRRSAVESQIGTGIAVAAVAVVLAIGSNVLFRRLIARHLESLSRFLRGAGEADLEAEFRPARSKPRGDELDRLVDSTNQLRRRLHARLQERATLASEIHHRVKNDLSLVAALLSLQESRIENREATAALSEARGRIAVLSRTYSHLHRSGKLQSIAINDFLCPLLMEMEQGLLPSNVHVDANIEAFAAPARVCVSLGIVLNELLTNSIKYAVTEGQGHRISVVATRADIDGGLVLTVADNGPGLPEDVLDGRRLGYGLTIVESLARSNQGSVELLNNGGAVVTVHFALK